MKNSDNTSYQLDSIDKEIIYMLMDNSKTSLAHISKGVGISTTAVHQRIKKLEQAGVIENSISFLNPKKNRIQSYFVHRGIPGQTKSLSRYGKSFKRNQRSGRSSLYHRKLYHFPESTL